MPISRDSRLRDSMAYGDDQATENVFEGGAGLAAASNSVEAERPKPLPTFWPELMSYVHLGFFALVGCNLRIVMEDAVVRSIAPDDNALFQDLPGNMLGCFFIGLFTSAAAQNRGEQSIAVFPLEWTWIQNNAALQLGLRTGFCGSLTTFATWQFSMTKLWFNEYGGKPYSSAWSALFGWVIGLLLSIASVTVGEHFACLIMDYQNMVRNAIHKKEGKSTAKDDVEVVEMGRGDCCGGLVAELCCKGGEGVFLAQSFVLFAFTAFYATSIALASTEPETKDTGRIMLALVFAPLGAILRWRLSKLNGYNGIKTFFMGTFLANFFGSVVDGVVYGMKYDLLASDHATQLGTKIKIHILEGVGTGFSGCLTTVSTFMTEIVKLLPKEKGIFPLHSYVYALTTIVLSNGACSLIYYIVRIKYTP